MESSWIVVGITALFLIACLVLGLLPGRKSSSTAVGFVAGDRSLGLLVMYFITGATVFSAFAFLGAPGWAYSRGAAVFYILSYGTLGFVPFYFFGPRAAQLGRAHGYVTQAEMVAGQYQSRLLPGLMVVISLMAFVPYLALQMKGAGLILESVTQGAVPVWMGAAIVYAVVMIYVLGSGVNGVGWTNTFQGLLMMVLAWTLGLYLPYKLYGGIGPMFTRITEERPELLLAPGLKGGEAWSWSEYSSAVLMSILGFTMWPHLFMKAFTAQDDATLRRTVVLYPTFQLFIVPLILIGFAGVLFHSAPASPDQILPHMLMGMDLPPLIVGIFCVGGLAASMSSGDAMAHACGSIIVRDGLMAAGGMKLDEARQRTLIRVSLCLTLFASYALAIMYPDTLVQLLLWAFGPVGQFLPVVVATLYLSWPTRGGLAAGLIVGTTTTIALSVRPDWQPLALHAGLYGLVANVIAVVVVSALRPAARPSVASPK